MAVGERKSAAPWAEFEPVQFVSRLRPVAVLWLPVVLEVSANAPWARVRNARRVRCAPRPLAVFDLARRIGVERKRAVGRVLRTRRVEFERLVAGGRVELPVVLAVSANAPCAEFPHARRVRLERNEAGGCVGLALVLTWSANAPWAEFWNPSC